VLLQYHDSFYLKYCEIDLEKEVIEAERQRTTKEIEDQRLNKEK